jgi:hypothetical protein
MELNTAQLRIVISALNFQIEHYRSKHAKLDESKEDEIAELTDDILARECLLGELEEVYQKTFSVQNRAQAWG